MNCQEFNNLIVDYIEGTLALDKRKGFEGHLEECSNCRTAFNYYMEVVDGLHELPQEECPERVVEKIFQSVPARGEKPSFLANIYQVVSERFTWQIRFAAAAAVVIISILLFYPEDKDKEFVQQTYKAEEIDKVRKDMTLALGYLSYCYVKIEDIIEKKVIPNYLIKPIETSMKSAFKEIINGG